MNDNFIRTICREIQMELLASGTAEHSCNWREEMIKPVYDIWIIESGIVEIELHNKRYHLQKGDMMFLYPRHFYKAHAVSDGCKFCYTQFNAFIGMHMHPLEMFNLCDIYASSVLGDDGMRFIHENKQYAARIPMSGLALKGTIMQLITRAYRNKAKTGNIIFAETRDEKQLRFGRLLQYIHDNLESTISVSDLANQMYLSEKYFISYFKSIMGVTPHQYITELRLKRAYRYLNDEECAISEIARRFGYSDSYSFSKAYKKHFGFPPSRQTKE